MYTSGRLPLRAKGVDSGLPTDGRGRHEWRGFLSAKAHPQGRNPRGGVLNNWNNKPALGFPARRRPVRLWLRAARGPAEQGHREARRKHDLASVIGAMNAAATQDVRAVVFQPVLSRRAAGRSALPARGRCRCSACSRLAPGRRQPAGPRPRRQDRPPGRGDHGRGLGRDRRTRACAACSARSWRTSSTRTCTAASTSRRAASSAAGTCTWTRTCGRCSGAGCAASSRTATAAAAGSRRCRAELWRALDRAGARLARPRAPIPPSGARTRIRERIEFVPGLLPYTMRYTNRPSGIQQVISFPAGGRRTESPQRGANMPPLCNPPERRSLRSPPNSPRLVVGP